MITKEQLAKQKAFEFKIDYKPWIEDLPYNEYAEEGFYQGFLAGQPKWISVSVQEPPKQIELLVKSPEGIICLANWREAYNIFTCQDKREGSYDWQWMEIP